MLAALTDRPKPKRLSTPSRCLLVAFGAALVAPVLASTLQLPAAKPDFSGRWRMVKDKSDFGGFAVPDAVVRVVDHHDPTLNVHTIQTTGDKTTSADVSYFTDGSLSTNVINGHEGTSKAYWDGPVLVIRTSMKDSKNEDVNIEDRWELSDDQQILTNSSHIETPKGQVDMKLVSIRQKAAPSPP
jgi:hypothetical protein